MKFKVMGIIDGKLIGNGLRFNSKADAKRYAENFLSKRPGVSKYRIQQTADVPPPSIPNEEVDRRIAANYKTSMNIACPETKRGHRKTPSNRYTLVVLFALALTCATACAEDGPKLTDAQYAALRAAVGGSVIENPDPPGAGNYRRSANMTKDGVIVATDSREPGVVNVSYVPGANPIPFSEAVNNQATQAAIANITQMNLDMAAMKRDQQIINAAIAQGKQPTQEFREAFEKAEQAAIVAAQQPAQARIVQSEEPRVAYKPAKSLVSLEKGATQ